MAFSNGVYTAPTGATTQVAGNVLQSAVWNNIGTDYAAAFNAVLSRYGLDSAEGTIASAATTDLSTVTVIRTNVTGTATITSFGTGANLWRLVRFSGSLTLTHNASSLILPGAANIQTSAGDVAFFTSDGSGNWRCEFYSHTVNGVDVPEATIASAATTDLSTSNSSRVNVTGVVTITSFGTGANLIRIVRFAGALILTYNATSLILPGAKNITTAAGDEAIFTSDGSGNWRCVSYTLNNALPIAPAEITFTVRTVSVSTANTDVAVSIPLPVGSSNYVFDGIRIANATAAANTATVGVFTAAGAGGTAIVAASTAVTVTTSAVNTNNNTQAFTIVNQNTNSWNVSPIFFRTMTGTATSQVDLFVTIRPL
jgi:hypothetical protein